MNEMNTESKEILLSGAKNARLVADGIIRADCLDRLTAGDMAVLTGRYNLKTVIDLRTETEARERPDVEIPGVTYIRIPLMEEKTAGITKEAGTDPVSIASNLPDMPSLYRAMVSKPHCLEALSRVLQNVLAPENRTVLFHCTAGKDRTGIVAMLVLSYLGYPEEYIMEEYLRSNIFAIPDAEAFSRIVEQKSGSSALAEKVRHVFVADSSYLSGAIDEIKARHGDIRRFAESLLGRSHHNSME